MEKSELVRGGRGLEIRWLEKRRDSGFVITGNKGLFSGWNLWVNSFCSSPCDHRFGMCHTRLMGNAFWIPTSAGKQQTWVTGETKVGHLFEVCVILRFTKLVFKTLNLSFKSWESCSGKLDYLIRHYFQFIKLFYCLLWGFWSGTSDIQFQRTPETKTFPMGFKQSQPEPDGNNCRKESAVLQPCSVVHLID